MVNWQWKWIHVCFVPPIHWKFAWTHHARRASSDGRLTRVWTFFCGTCCQARWSTRTLDEATQERNQSDALLRVCIDARLTGNGAVGGVEQFVIGLARGLS